MINSVKSILYSWLRQVPVGCSFLGKRRFKVERALINGLHRCKNSKRSIIHFSVNKAGTQYVKSILGRCAKENGMVHVRINDYAFNSDFPFLDHLSAEEMVQYQHIFKPAGYLYSVFGGMVEGIPNLDDYLVVLVVRDPRDVLTSKYYSMAHSHSPPKGREKAESFMKHRALARRVGIDQYVIIEGDSIQSVYQRYLDLLVKRRNVYVVSYEDMILDFSAWLDGLLDYCQLEIDAQLRHDLLEEARRSRPTKEDVSRHLRQVNPGDHQRKLKPDTIAHLNSVFSNVLSEFNYA